MPERLSGLDASFVYIDNARVHMHTLKLLTLDCTTIPGGYSYPGLVRAIHRAAAGLPNWCCKLAAPDHALGHPRWVPDEDFDIHAHVERIVVASRRELDQVVATTMGRPLQRDRPLWHATIIEGSSGEHVAIALKIHHSLADGMAFARVLQSIASTRPEDTAPRVPMRVRTRGTTRTLLGQLARLPALLGRTLWAVAVRSARRLYEHRPLTWLFRGPKLSFNASLPSGRTFARASLELATVKRIKNAFDASINDVVMAIAAEALRRWIERRGLDTSRPLVAGMPVSAEEKTDRGRRSGNVLAHVPVCLHTNIDDPIDRLRAIHRSSQRAKTDLEIAGHDLLARWSELTLPSLLRRLWSLVPRLPRPPINLVLANVPGPRERLHFAGAEVEDLTSVGPILDGVGLNITAWSYCDRLNYGLLAAPEQVPDLAELATDMVTAAAQMEARATRVHRTPAAPTEVVPHDRAAMDSGWLRGSADALPSQMARYFAAGTLSFAVDLVVLSVLHVALRMDLLVAGAVAFTVGVTINYLLAVRWVFPHRSLRRSKAAEYLAYVAIGLTGLGLNEIVLWGISHRLGAHFVLAKGLSGLVVLAWTFAVRRAVLFRRDAVQPSTERAAIRGES